MVSKNQIKLITSLQQKKYRNKHKLFVAEGSKVIQELLSAHFVLDRLFVTEENLYAVDSDVVQHVTLHELYKISNLSTPNKALALFKIPRAERIDMHGIIVALDDVKDPGNLGTIIRLCDWFGVRYLLCSKETVDCYNPKVVQASMGSLARVHVVYAHLPELLSETSLPVFAAATKGDNIYTTALPEKGILVVGNEANGISKDLFAMAEKTVRIPNFSHLQQAESLNVATATAILLSEFKRKSTVIQT